MSWFMQDNVMPVAEHKSATGMANGKASAMGPNAV